MFLGEGSLREEKLLPIKKRSKSMLISDESSRLFRDRSVSKDIKVRDRKMNLVPIPEESFRETNKMKESNKVEEEKGKIQPSQHKHKKSSK